MQPFSRAQSPWAIARRAQTLGLLCAVALLLGSPRAHAVAPMCDPSGASVPAPIPAPPSATGDLAPPKSCDDATHGWVEASEQRRDSPSTEPGWQLPDRVIALPQQWPARPGILVAGPDSERPPDLPGFALPVYRPPRG